MIEALRGSARAHAIPESRREPVADEHLQRLTRTGHVGQLRLQLVDAEQAGMGVQENAQDDTLGFVMVGHGREPIRTYVR